MARVNLNWLLVLFFGALLTVSTACEVDGEGSDAVGSDGTSGADTSGTSGSTSGSVSTATVTISTAGVSPKVVTIARNGTVTFINNDDQAQKLLFSDNSALDIAQGGQATKSFAASATYRSDFKAEAAFQGTITVQ
jgi:hypothetical protein